MDRKQLRERIITTYWEIHHERNCGRCEDSPPSEGDDSGEGQADRESAGPGTAGSGM